MRHGGGGGGRGGGRGRAGYGRRDARPGASRGDRDRRPDYRPRRSPSPERRPRLPRAEDDDRDPPRAGRTGYGGDRDPHRPGHTDYGGDRDPPRREHMDYGRERDAPRRGHPDYGDDRLVSPGRGRRDYGDDRDGSRRGLRDYNDPHGVPDRGPKDYRRMPYRQDRDRYDRPGRGASESYEAPPDYMLPDHPSDLGRPSLRAGKKQSEYLGGPSDRTIGKESDYLGGPSDRSLGKDSEYFGGGPGGRSIDKKSELFGDGGVTLRISATELGRTSSMYLDRRSPPPRAVLSPPRLYPSVPPTETGFLTGGSAMKASDGFGAGSTRLLHDGSFKYRKHSHDPYIERSREIERHYPGSRDVVFEKDGGTERFYSAGEVPAGRDRETERLFSSRGMPDSDLVPCTQLKVIGDSSSALLAKDHPYRMCNESGYERSNGYIMDGLGRLSHDSLGHGSGHAHRLSGSPLEHGSGHDDKALVDITRQAHSKHAPRAQSMEYDAHDEYVTRDPINDAYVASENLRGNISPNSRHISGSAFWRGLKDGRISHHPRLSHRMEEDEDSFQAMRHDTEHCVQHSYNGDASVQYPPARGGNDLYSHSPGTEPIGIARRPARQHEFASFEDLSEQEVSPMVSRKRYRSPAPACSDHEIDVYQADDGFAGQEHSDDDMDAYDLPPPRMSRTYDMVGDDEYDERYGMPTSRNVFSRLALPHETNGEWTGMDQGNHPHSNILAYGRSKYVPMSHRLSRPDSHSQFGGPSMHGRGRGGLTKSAKKRLRTPHKFHGGYPSERNEFIRTNKFSKTLEDDPNGSEVKHEEAPEYEDLPMQKDPPEGSEEFNKQVHQAFLKYAKILNESPAMQKKYREASKGSLSCCVCGSVARKFPDLDALLSHAYDTCKVGLKTKHLGFHKALCVLMGWNWHVAPDTSKAHHSIPAEEVNAMKADLMLWPPVVMIHNSSIANEAQDTEAKIVSIGEIEGVLADIGVPREKVKVSHGRPANQSVFLVKFQPTISGFQEAMRIHDHFSTRNHGKEEFQQMRGGKGKKAAPVDNMEEMLYGHIAVVEDLGHLDEETKRRCKVRSKKEIEVNADATLNLEP